MSDNEIIVEGETVVPVESEEDKAARLAAEAQAEAERIAAEAEAKAEAERIAAEEAHKALVEEQKPQALRTIRYDFYTHGADPCVAARLASFDPEAVAWAKGVHDADVAKLNAPEPRGAALVVEVAPKRRRGR